MRRPLCFIGQIPVESTVKHLYQSNFLKDALRAYYGKDDIELRMGVNGKPYADALPGSFNLSHSGSLTALYITPDCQDAGCDIQLASGKYSEKEIAELCFVSEERAFSGNFFLMWTLKEAFLKAKGLSVFDMPSFSVLPEIKRFMSWELTYGKELYYLSLYPAKEPLTINCPCSLRRVL